MNCETPSTINVAPHPATYMPLPPPKKGYVPRMKRDPNDIEPPSMDLLTFPSLNTKFPVSHPLTPLNYLSKVKEAQEKREDNIYDHTKIASMTKKQLQKEGWATVTRNGVEGDDMKPLLSTEPTYVSDEQLSSLPFHPDSPRLRRKVMVSPRSYTDLYDIDYQDGEIGAVVPSYTAYCDGDDGENSV